MVSECRVFFQRDSNPSDEVGGRFLVDGIYLLDDRVFYDLVGVSLCSRCLCYGVYLGQTFHIAIHVAHTHMGLRAMEFARMPRVRE